MIDRARVSRRTKKRMNDRSGNNYDQLINPTIQTYGQVSSPNKRPIQRQQPTMKQTVWLRIKPEQIPEPKAQSTSDRTIKRTECQPKIERSADQKIPETSGTAENG